MRIERRGVDLAEIVEDARWRDRRHVFKDRAHAGRSSPVCCRRILGSPRPRSSRFRLAEFQSPSSSLRR